MQTPLQYLVATVEVQSIFQTVLPVLKGAGCSVAPDRDIFTNDLTLPPPVGRLNRFLNIDAWWAFVLSLGRSFMVNIVLFAREEINLHANKTVNKEDNMHTI